MPRVLAAYTGLWRTVWLCHGGRTHLDVCCSTRAAELEARSLDDALDDADGVLDRAGEALGAATSLSPPSSEEIQFLTRGLTLAGAPSLLELKKPIH